MDINEIPAYIETHNTVVSKILKGESNWSPAELQHYQNYPSEVERAVRLYNSGVNVSPQGCVCQNQRGVFSSSWTNYGHMKELSPKPKQCNAVLYVALALTLGGTLESRDGAFVAVAIVDDNNVDVAVVAVGDGVCETKGLYGGTHISLAMACDMAWGMCSEDVSHIDVTYLVGNHSLEKSTQQVIHEHFSTIPRCFVIYNDLLEIAFSLCEGIIDGIIRNLLIVDVLPMPVAIMVEKEEHLPHIIPVFDAGCTIPTKRCVKISMKEYPLPVRISVLQGDFQRTVNKRLWELRTLDSFKLADMIGVTTSSIELCIDVNSDGLFVISEKDIT